jgi:Flp pilus assembly protein TadB
MSGGCWGVEQANPDQIDEIPIQLSIGTFLWGMLAYFMPTNISVLMFLVGFCLLLWTETNPIFRRVYTESYKKMRNILTGVVAALHILVFIVVN